MTYLNQRHFASAIGILLLVLVFLVIRYRAVAARKIKAGSRLINDVAASLCRGVRAFLPKRSRRHSTVATTSVSYEIVHNDTLSPKPDALTETARSAMADGPQAGGYNYTLSDNATPAEIPAERETEVTPPPTLTEPQQQTLLTSENFRATLSGFIFSGVLLGLLPMWNSAVFIAAAAILGLLFILCPLRLQMVALAVTAGCDCAATDAVSEHRERLEPRCRSSFTGAIRSIILPSRMWRSTLGSSLGSSGC